MNKKFIILFLSLIATLILIKADAGRKAIKTYYTIVLSMDGFRYDYPEMADTPNLDSIERAGVRSAMIPVFPSKTFVNHYSMATGLYPENHGIVLNSFYDYNTKSWYHPGNRESVRNGNYYNGVPIWNSAEKQGLKAGCYFWVGSEADIENMHPSYYKYYNHDMPFEDRIDSVVSWLEKPYQLRPRLIMWYIHQPDSWGHQMSPDHRDFPDKIVSLDNLIGKYLKKLNNLTIADSINVIITSDHGMSSINRKQTVIIEDYIKPEWIKRFTGSNPVFMFEPMEGYIDSILNSLKNSEHLNVWRRINIPDKLHFSDNDRIMPVVAVADSGWSLLSGDNYKTADFPGGTHGYLPSQNDDMKAVFYARGPSFKKGYHHPAFKNVNLYTLLIHLLRIKPAPNQGSFCKIRKMLK